MYLGNTFIMFHIVGSYPKNLFCFCRCFIFVICRKYSFWNHGCHGVSTIKSKFFFKHIRKVVNTVFIRKNNLVENGRKIDRSYFYGLLDILSLVVMFSNGNFLVIRSFQSSDFKYDDYTDLSTTAIFEDALAIVNKI